MASSRTLEEEGDYQSYRKDSWKSLNCTHKMRPRIVGFVNPRNPEAAFIMGCSVQRLGFMRWRLDDCVVVIDHSHLVDKPVEMGRTLVLSVTFIYW